jgi:signal transduction histidine kinase
VSAQHAHGSGLGLLLTKAIIERAHDGHLSYSPNKPRGSRFEIRLPLGV